MKKLLNIMEERSTWKEEVKKIKQCYQRQDYAIDQLKDLRHVANKLGFYDAADFIRSIVEDK